MGTNLNIIRSAQLDVTPHDVFYVGPVPEAGTLVPLDCRALRRKVEQVSAQRQLNWEEWMDVREAWCRHFQARYVACVLGDNASATSIQNAAFQGERTGKKYILIDYI